MDDSNNPGLTINVDEVCVGDLKFKGVTLYMDSSSYSQLMAVLMEDTKFRTDILEQVKKQEETQAEIREMLARFERVMPDRGML